MNQMTSKRMVETTIRYWAEGQTAAYVPEAM